MQIIFISSSAVHVQGKAEDIYKKYGEEYKIEALGGGNGNWLVTKKSDVLVNGKSYRKFVLAHYGKMKLTEKLVEKFRKDVEDGRIKL